MKCYYSNKNKTTSDNKNYIWEEKKDKIIEMRRNGFSMETLKKRFNLNGNNFSLEDKLKDIKQEKNARSFYKVPVDLTPSEDLFYILGVLHGDGSVYKTKYKGNWNFHRYSLSVNDKDFAEAFNRSCWNIGLRPNFHKHKSKNCKQGFQWRVEGDSKIFVDWFNGLNYDYFNDMEEPFKISFLRGIFDSEGSVNKYNVNITSTEYELMLLISKLMENIGFDNEIKTIDTVLRGKEYRMYRIYLNNKNGAKDFIETINPSISRKRWEEN
jgi:hypothetical protein